jgi:hypothetical protein
MTVQALVTYKLTLWPAVLWVRLMRVAKNVIGTERAERWAIGGVRRLLRPKIKKVEFLR